MACEDAGESVVVADAVLRDGQQVGAEAGEALGSCHGSVVTGDFDADFGHT